MQEASSRRGRLFSVESVAGWVFADLLLVLFIVGLGSAMAYTPPPPPPEKDPEPAIIGMRTDPTKVTVQVAGGQLADGTKLSTPEKKAVCQAVRSKLAPVKGKRAALVLVFGGAGDVTSGQNVARAISSQLKCASPRVFRGKVPTRAFWDGSLPLGQARLEIFLFIQQKKGAA